MANLERKIDKIIENGYAELIKEVEANRKRILNITICNSEQLGKALMMKSKQFNQGYIHQGVSTKDSVKNNLVEESYQAKKDASKKTPHDDNDEQPEDVVIQPDLPPLFEDDSMNESMHEIEDDFDNEAYTNANFHSSNSTSYNYGANSSHGVATNKLPNQV